MKREYIRHNWIKGIFPACLDIFPVIKHVFLFLPWHARRVSIGVSKKSRVILIITSSVMFHFILFGQRIPFFPKACLQPTSWDESIVQRRSCCTTCSSRKSCLLLFSLLGLQKELLSFNLANYTANCRWTFNNRRLLTDQSLKRINGINKILMLPKLITSLEI